jgi:hypothetical protein
VFANLNHLYIYDIDLATQLADINTNQHIVSQLDSFFFFGDTQSKDIIGFWAYNSSQVAYRVYSFNQSLNNLQQTFEKNYTGSFFNFSAIMTFSSRNTLSSSYFIMPQQELNNTGFSSNFVILNRTGEWVYPLPDTTALLTQPLAIRDMNGDGELEFMSYSRGNTNTDELMVFNRTGKAVFTYYTPSHASSRILTSARIYRSDLTNNWKIAISEVLLATTNYQIKGYNLAGTNLFTNSYTPSGSSVGSLGAMSVSDNVGDYNGDGISDIFSVITKLFSPRTTFHLSVYSGSGGTLIDSVSYAVPVLTSNFAETSLTTADMNHDGKQDFIVSYGDGVTIYDVYNGNMLFQSNGTQNFGFYSCIPADLTQDGLQEVICSGQTQTLMLQSNLTQSSPYFTSIIISPSLTIGTGQVLSFNMTAFDTNGDTPYFSKKCFVGDSWNIPTTSNILTCSYAIAGTYLFTLGVKDLYHSTYTEYSDFVNVIESGTSCNNNLICEANLGENYVSCPNDCSAPTPTQPNGTTQAEGGMAIPTKIVDTENTDEGLLPSIYYGILAFFSLIALPTMILVFLIFFVLIIIAIAFIIKRIAQMVAKIGK